MIKEKIIFAKTVEHAKIQGAKELEVAEDAVMIEILEEPKKGILGLGASDAKVRVYYEETPAIIAKNYLESLIANLGVEATVNIDELTEESAYLTISGENLGFLIGRHGDALDSLQFLTTLAANREYGDRFFRITVDIEKYRLKRIETLQQIARRTAEKTLKFKRNNVLEPMNAYERRIIHAYIQEIEGVTTYSTGSENERRVVVALDKKNAEKKQD